MIALPVDGHLETIDAALTRHRAVVVVAEPGAGKSTRIPPHLARRRRVLLLQPRRAAARAIAARIAVEQDWTIGRQVGWHVRLDRRFQSETQLVVATEGILTACLQQDPLLSDFQTIILDEFHERSIHADLGIALAKQAWLARSDLQIVVMSATIDAAPVSEFLDECPIVTVPGALYPVEISYRPGIPVAEAAASLLASTDASVLCFLPGAREIEQAVRELRARVPAGTSVLPLHGALDADAQDAALRTSGSERRIVVATNIAETSVTVQGVHAVVDAGWQKVARYDASRAIDSLETERITQDAADQRAGRAGRLAPGQVVRLWDQRDRLRPHREPEIARVDLSGTILSVVAWGGDPLQFHWYESPSRDRLDAAVRLLERLGAIRGQRITAVGEAMQALSLHPRLARIIIAAGGDLRIARACALLEERNLIPARSTATTSDVLSALDRWSELPVHVHRTAAEIQKVAGSIVGPMAAAGVTAQLTDAELRWALLAGYPDRVGQRRQPGSARVKLSSGTGAIVSQESGVVEGDFLIAIDVQASTRPDQPDGRIRIASQIERDWLDPTETVVRHWIDEAGTARAARVDLYDRLELVETPIKPDAEAATPLLVDAWLAATRTARDATLLRRISFAGAAVDLTELVRAAAYGARSVAEIDIERALPRDVGRRLDAMAPATLEIPSGRMTPLTYGDDGSVSASVKLQELFGLTETPRIGTQQEPVTFHLLAPNGRPVQTTQDLRSFWNRTYPEVRKELRGRYPRHPWPEDPWTALPTARTTRKNQR